MSLEHWIDTVKELYDERMQDPYFNKIIDEYKYLMEAVRYQKMYLDADTLEVIQ